MGCYVSPLLRTYFIEKNMNLPIRFIVSLFGDRHANMLLPLLFSIEESNPQASVSVYWEDINNSTIQLIASAFPRVEWIETAFDFSTDITKRISSKTLVWERAAHDKALGKGEWLVFLDADTLVIKEIGRFLCSIMSDAVFTYRDCPFPINSGVVIFRDSPKTAQFFTLWREKTMHVLTTPDLYGQANDKRLPYGGADQMALHLLLGYSIKQRDYTVPIDGGMLTIRMEACEDLNETSSVPITERTRIIHYKGGWRSILFEGGIFTKNRPKNNSWEMFVLYHSNFQKAIQTLNQRTARTMTMNDFNFTSPIFLNPQTLQERPGLYPIHWAVWQLKSFFPRLKHYLADRLR